MKSRRTPHILTPDQRLRVYISSASEELGAERAAVRDAVTALHLAPVMVDVPAGTHAPRDVYAGYIEQSHVFVGIYGDDYGPIAPGARISAIEDEYDLATDKPRLLYVKSGAGGRDERSTALIERFKDDSDVSLSLFSDPDELVERVENDLVILLTEHFLAGGTSPDEDITASESVLGDARVPAPVSTLIGRERELRELQKSLDEMRLVTITGPGGTGKTRLAIEVLRELGSAELEGPWVVELAGLQGADLVPTAVAQTLGLVAHPGRDTTEALAEVIGERRGLLVLDNCEHVIVAASALVADLLITCPNLTVLATSREPLNVRGESVYPLEPLPVTATDIAGNEIDGDAERLFVARAAEIVPGFELTDANRDAIRKICAVLDGLPLAIELAASRLRALSPQQLADRLDDRFAVLTHGARDLPDRQQTLLATIDWSYDLLADPERKLFTQLSVFRGGFELDAVESITGHTDVDLLDLLDGLVLKSLVSVEANGRYSMLESVRAYGLRRSTDEERDDLQRRHVDWARGLVTQAEAKFRGPDAVRWFDRLDRETDNLRAAMTFATESGDHLTVLGIAGRLGWLWYRRGYVSEARYWFEPALAAAPNEPTKERGLALIGLAGIEYLDGALVEAAGHAMEAIAVAEEVGDVATHARALIYAAYFQATLGRFEEAEGLARAGRDLATAHSLRDTESEANTALGQLARVLGRGDEAEALFLEGAAMASDVGHRWHEGSSYWLAAKVALDRGDAVTAAERIRHALRLITSEGDRTSTLVGLHTMSAALALTGSPEDGAMLIGAVAAVGEKIGFFPERMDPLDGAMTIERVRATLDEDAYERAVERGRNLTIDDALIVAGV